MRAGLALATLNSVISCAEGVIALHLESSCPAQAARIEVLREWGIRNDAQEAV